MKKRNKRTYTKTMVRIIMFFAIVDLQLSYLLAFLGREQIAENLSIVVVTEIIGVSLGYFMKAYFETKQSEKQRLKEQLLNENKGDEL